MFDVVLLDISLPDSEGLETIQTAKQLVADIPIVVLTGQADSDFALKALTAGAADYMVKGDFGFDGLSRIICYALARKEMETENNLLVTALTSAANAIIITDKNAIIKWANPAFYKLTGYAAYETIGRLSQRVVKIR
jgi:DNA-binding NtrC family response regulator